jgi:membrane carboxypeptidase/penicillin-binding protein PbpC
VITAPGAEKLTIISPAPRERILLNDDLPPDRQQVLLESSSAASGDRWWFVDDHVVGRERRIWWSPVIGPHRVRLVDGDGRSAAVEIRVERFE